MIKYIPDVLTFRVYLFSSSSPCQHVSVQLSYLQQTNYFCFALEPDVADNKLMQSWRLPLLREDASSTELETGFILSPLYSVFHFILKNGYMMGTY